MNKNTKIKNNILNSILKVMFFIIAPIIIAFNVEFLQRADFQSTLEWSKQNSLQFMLSVMLVFIVFLLLYFIFRKTYLSTIFTGLLFTILGLVNHFKVALRGDPLLPSELKLGKEAADMVGKLGLDITKNIIISIVVIIVLILIAKFFINDRKMKLWQSIVGIVISLMLMYVAINNVYFNDSFMSKNYVVNYKWDQRENYTTNGFITAFVFNCQTLVIEEPEQYGKNSTDELINVMADKEMGNSKEGKDLEKQPNIIMIMNETYWDPRVLDNVEFPADYMPVLDKLRETSATGYVLTPQFGGGTCNVEFEALTGNSMEFLPPGSVPYNEFIKKPIGSVTSYLKDMGYSTTAIHSHERWFWNRESVYENLGFDEFIDKSQMQNQEIKGNYVSDKATYDEIIYQYNKKKEEGKPFFNFTITMQNHIPHIGGNFEELVDVKSDKLSPEDLEALKWYATSMKESDRALGELINYFSNVEEPTVILMFGDHLPRLGDNSSVYTNSGYISSEGNPLENQVKYNTTPIIAWNNFDNEKEDIGVVSAYGISPYLLEYAGIELPPYFKFLENQREHIKASIPGIAVNPDGEIINEFTDEQQQFKDIHKFIQYDIIFGKDYGGDFYFKQNP